MGFTAPTGTIKAAHHRRPMQAIRFIEMTAAKFALAYHSLSARASSDREMVRSGLSRGTGLTA